MTAKRKTKPMTEGVLIRAKCIGCGVAKDIGEGDVAAGEHPMCDRCFMPMIAERAARNLPAKGKR